MPVGVFDLFKIGIGPSSSHTVGPMKAANFFTRNLGGEAARIVVTLYGSLAWTGKGHSTDKAITLGLAGALPESLDPDLADAQYEEIKEKRCIGLIGFDPARDIVFDFKHVFPEHPNGMRFEAFDAEQRCLAREIWFSIGGGFGATAVSVRKRSAASRAWARTRKVHCGNRACERGGAAARSGSGGGNRPDRGSHVLLHRAGSFARRRTSRRAQSEAPSKRDFRSA